MECQGRQQRNLGVGTILRLRTHKLVALILGVVVLGAIVTGGIALASSLTAQPAPSPAPKVAALPSAIAEHFAVLNEAATDSSGVASIESAGVDSKAVADLEESQEGINAQFGGDAALAREVTYGQSQHVWVVPGSNGICIHDFETGEGGCAPIADSVAGTLTIDVGGDENGIAGGGTIYGLAPNGNPMIVVHDADGSTEDVPVQHNVYIITHRGAVSIEVVDGSGELQKVALPG